MFVVSAVNTAFLSHKEERRISGLFACLLLRAVFARGMPGLVWL
jgi:hypothetical protein